MSAASSALWQNKPHIPVMMREVLQYLAPREDEILVDGTFGAGGYSEAILSSADCILYGIDRDPLAERYLERLLDDAGVEEIDGLVLDLGVSSMQLDDGERGFSFRFDGPLDMRMGEGELTAEIIVKE